MAKEQITLDNFTDWSGEVQGVSIRSVLPFPEYVPTQEIDVNLGRIATLARLSRLESLRIGLYDESQQMSFAVSGVNQDGSATAVAGKADTARRSSSDVHSPSGDPFEFPRGYGTIKINTSHPDMNDKVLRDAEPWAVLLDHGVKDGINGAAQKQLLQPKRERAVVFGGVKAVQMLLGGACALAFQEPAFLPAYMVYATMDDCIGLTRKILPGLTRKNLPEQDYEHSLFFKMPLDRFVAVKLLASTHKIVKAK